MSSNSSDTSLSIAPSTFTPREPDVQAGIDAEVRRELDGNFYLSDVIPVWTYAPDDSACASSSEGVARNFIGPVGLDRSDATQGFWNPSRSITALWNYWKSEREVRRVTRALAEFDDHTLRNLGIRNRSQIEFTVRFCREC